MSKLEQTRRAYDKITELLDQEIRGRRGATRELEEFRRLLDTAFYLLGWGQFEFLVRRASRDAVEEHARTNTVHGHAWRQIQVNIKALTVRQQLDIIFHADPRTRAELNKDYTVRNEVAHDNQLPREAKDLSAWFDSLEEAVDKFQR
ncbi:hypothetical protein [Sphingomonas phyllosphaerae]|uniref:hypothetical protein n=1 Tax=Sphingomonas phyllosphaerae TaxID=257003 RepID=UPI00241374B7|nr:hypothetical protein [Sphingomonas phyllosphaerae]